jgi:uncharacterized repeat protein (TIGR02543 family)
VHYGGKVIAPANPSRTGHLFGGWYKEASLTNVWNFTADTVTADTALYAKWTADTFNVSFESNGGSAVPGQTVQYGGKVMQPANPSRPGCIFGGWYRDVAFTHAWDFSAETVTGDITLYARWDSAGTYIIKTGVNNVRFGKVKGAGSYKGGSKVELTAVPGNGYRFVKWTEGKKTASENAVYTFDAAVSRSLTACFDKIGMPKIKNCAPAGNGMLKLKWSPVKGANGYFIYRAASKSGAYKKVAAVQGAAEYTDAGLKTGASYSYKVQAYCVAGLKTTTGDKSSAKGAALPLSKAGGLALVKINAGSVNITYGAVPDATGYEIYRSEKKSSGYKKIKALKALSYTNTGLAAGRTYYYKIRAYRTAGGKKAG